jgi:hypothetical protein
MSGQVTLTTITEIPSSCESGVGTESGCIEPAKAELAGSNSRSGNELSLHPEARTEKRRIFDYLPFQDALRRTSWLHLCQRLARGERTGALDRASAGGLCPTALARGG